MNQTEIINEIIEREGGYVNDSADSGGETMHGITAKVAIANGYSGEMSKLPRALAFDIYSRRYWHAVAADDIYALSAAIAEEVVDTAVNMGPNRAGRILQRALNALHPVELFVDGRIGPATLRALGGYLERREEVVMLRALNCLQGEFYIALTERRSKDKKFIYGWLKNRVVL